MLVDFQQALADLTASPARCIRARQDPSTLSDEYQLTVRELNRLVGIVRHSGMACACSVYRANRLAPLAMNIPDTCRALGADLRGVMEDFWARYPEANVHFFVETDRFCRFLNEVVAAGRPVPAEVAAVLARDSETIAVALAASQLEAQVR